MKLLKKSIEKLTQFEKIKSIYIKAQYIRNCIVFFSYSRQIEKLKSFFNLLIKLNSKRENRSNYFRLSITFREKKIFVRKEAKTTFQTFFSSIFTNRNL